MFHFIAGFLGLILLASLVIIKIWSGIHISHVVWMFFGWAMWFPVTQAIFLFVCAVTFCIITVTGALVGEALAIVELVMLIMLFVTKKKVKSLPASQRLPILFWIPKRNAL